MSEYKISIIMPVFNDEDFIRDALNSIFNQTLKELEVICVNDGSTDNSLEILKEYEAKYLDKIKIFNQKNQGSGIARNNAMLNATGEYVAFLDSDDIFIDDDALERMYNAAIKYDANMVTGNLKVINLNGELVINKNLPRFYEEKIITPDEYGIPYSFYKNIFKRKFLIENNFKFPDLLRGQDPVFFAEILVSLDNIPAVPVELYALRASENNFGKINTHRKKHDYLKHFKVTLDILWDSNFKRLHSLYKEQLFYYLNSPELNDEDKREIYLIIQDIFGEDKTILEECDKYFSKPKVSLIIPVYNAEEFLDESIGSLLNQTLHDIELVCVNDGSKDNSLKMLENFAKKDSRVVIIDQPNGGCGAARNKALDNAIGEYIYFFDPDDYILPNALEELYNNAKSNDSDFVIFKIASFRDGEPINYDAPGFEFEKIFPNVDFNNFTFSYKDVKRHVLLSSFAPWTKFYKKKFLDAYDDFRFHTNVAFDDVPFHVQSMLRASKISYVPKFFYHYRLSNPNSVNNTASNAPDILKIVNFVEDFLKSNGFYDEFKEEFTIFKIVQLSLYIISSNSEDYFNIVKQNVLDLDLYNTDVPVSITKRNDALKYFNSIVNSNSINDFKSNLANYNKPQIIYKEIQKDSNIDDEIIDLNKNFHEELDKVRDEINSLSITLNEFDNSYSSIIIESECNNLIRENSRLSVENYRLREKINFLENQIEFLRNKDVEKKSGFLKNLFDS